MDNHLFDEKLDVFFDELIEIRRHIHAHPELSGLEHQTAVLISGYLKEIDWKVQESVGRTGLTAEYGSSHKGYIGLRVDMDALPIQENTNLSFSSKVDGIMHACGHDIHTCIGLGVARLINSLDLQIGTRIIFQPAEEIASGAKWMINDGVTKDLRKLIGVHVYPDLPSGMVGIRDGGLTAAAGEISVDIIGKSAHGARPHQGVDAIWVAAKIISGVQELITRKLDALNPVVITFGKINGGKAYNVLADNVNILGTARCTDLNTFENLGDWLKQIISDIASSYGAQVVVKFKEITPPVNNDLQVNQALRNSAIELIGHENVIELNKPSMGAEDFAEFLNYVPGAMFRLGVDDNLNNSSPLHSAEFNPNEGAMKIAIKLITKSIIKLSC